MKTYKFDPDEYLKKAQKLGILRGNELPEMLSDRTEENGKNHFFKYKNRTDGSTLIIDATTKERVTAEHIPNKDLRLTWENFNIDDPTYIQRILSVHRPPKEATAYYAEYTYREFYGLGKNKQSLKISFYKNISIV